MGLVTKISNSLVVTVLDLLTVLEVGREQRFKCQRLVQPQNISIHDLFFIEDPGNSRKKFFCCYQWNTVIIIYHNILYNISSIIGCSFQISIYQNFLCASTWILFSFFCDKLAGPWTNISEEIGVGPWPTWKIPLCTSTFNKPSTWPFPSMPNIAHAHLV